MIPPQHSTSEGGRKKKMVHVPPLSDTEFEALLKTIPTQQPTNKIPKVSPAMNPTYCHKLSVHLTQKQTKRLLQHSKNILLKKQIKNSVNHIFNIDGHKESINTFLQGPDSKTWQQSLMNGLDMLAQGINSISGNDFLDFIHKSEVPTNKKVTYANMVCDF